MIFPIKTNLTYLEYVKDRFSKFSNAKFVQGLVPQVLKEIPQDIRVKYLSIDMNDGQAELEALEYFWPKIVKGGIIYFDDFGWGYPTLVKNVKEFIQRYSIESELLHFASGQSVLIKQ
jgi:hypothetical protein